MTENMAARGEGLAGALDLLEKCRPSHFDFSGALVHHEKPSGNELSFDPSCPKCVIPKAITLIRAALGAAAPASTAPGLRELIEELTPMVDFYLKREIESPSNHQEFAREASGKLDKWYELASIVPPSPKAALATPSPQAPKWGAEIAARAEFGDLSPTSAREQSSATASVNLSTAETEQCNWRGVPWRATIEGTNLAEEIVRHFAHAATELLACRSGWVDEETTLQPSDESVKEAEEDLFNVLMGHDSGCLDPEDLDETNCSFNWAESKLHELLTAWLATKPVPAAAQEPAGSGASEQLLQDFNAQFGLGIFVVTGDHQRTAFFSKEKAEQYLAQQDPERFRIVVYPKPDGGSPRKVGEDGQPSKLRPTYYVRHPDDTFSIADPQPVKEFKAILQQRINDILAVRNEYEEGDTATSHCFHLMEVERILDGKSVGFGELARPSSVPVGEQKQEEGA